MFLYAGISSLERFHVFVTMCCAETPRGREREREREGEEVPGSSPSIPVTAKERKKEKEETTAESMDEETVVGRLVIWSLCQMSGW